MTRSWQRTCRWGGRGERERGEGARAPDADAYQCACSNCLAHTVCGPQLSTTNQSTYARPHAPNLVGSCHIGPAWGLEAPASLLHVHVLGQEALDADEGEDEDDDEGASALDDLDDYIAQLGDELAEGEDDDEGAPRGGSGEEEDVDGLLDGLEDGEEEEEKDS